jgi:hypothetical protein
MRLHVVGGILSTMTYITSTQISGGRADDYRNILAALPTPEPDGLLARYAGASGDTFVVVAVWATKTHSDRFATELLGPAMRSIVPRPAGRVKNLEFGCLDEFTAEPSSLA